MTLIERIIHWFKSLFAPSGGSRQQPTADHAAPRQLIAQALESCDRNAMEYSDSKRQLPCTYAIYVSEQDFDFFYRANKDEVEGEIVSALGEYARQTGDLMKAPTVTLRIDTELTQGASRVDTSFEMVRSDPTPAFTVKSDEPSVVAHDATPAADELATEGMSHTPILRVEPRVDAKLIASDGTAYDLCDNATVGIVRDRSRELPELVLQPLPNLRFCSQRHGQFVAADEGGFAYRNLSRNGSVIVRAGESHRLEAGSEPFALCDGDMIVLGSGEPALTYVRN